MKVIYIRSYSLPIQGLEVNLDLTLLYHLLHWRHPSLCNGPMQCGLCHFENKIHSGTTEKIRICWRQGIRDIGKLSWEDRSRLKHKELYMFPIESNEFHLAKSSKEEVSHHLGPKETDHFLGIQMALISLLSLHSLDNLLIFTHELTCLPTLRGWHPIQFDYNFLAPQFKLLWEGICLVVLSFLDPLCMLEGAEL